MLPSRLRVPLGYVAGVLALALARPRPELLLVGGCVALAGESIRLWASGHIEKTQRLATGGPYAHSRNPLYLGSVVMAVGVSLAAASWWTLGIVVVYLGLFYPAVIREEAAFLRGKFAAEYPAWEQDVPLFLPRLWPGGPRGSRFSWERVRRNREWHTALAIPLLMLLLYARGRWLP